MKYFLTPYIAPTYPSQKQPARPPPEIVDEYEEYEVEEIMELATESRPLAVSSQMEKDTLNVTNGHGKPLCNLTHADQAVDDFHKSHPAAPWPIDMNDFTFVPITDPIH